MTSWKSDAPTVAIGYVRTSTDHQDLSVDAQRAAIQRAAGYHGWTVIWFEDQCSGSVPLVKRKQGKKALTLLGEGAAAKFVAAKFDRFTRSMRDLVDVIELGHTQGGGLVMLDFEGLDTLTSTGRLMAHAIVAVSEFERECIGERVTEGLDAKRASTRAGTQARRGTTPSRWTSCSPSTARATRRRPSPTS